MAPIMEIARRHGLFVIEDAAQAHGATYNGQRVGSFGDIACFSFYPGKNLGAYGDGGGVTSNDPAIIDRILMMRDHGSKKKYEHLMVGRNSRLDSMQAAILKIKLDRLDLWNEQRRQAAAWYGAALADVGVKLPSVRPGSTHVFHLYVIETDDREKLQSELAEVGIGTGIHYPVPLHQQPAFAGLCDPNQRFEQTEKSAPRILSLPMFPEITREQVEFVAREIGRIKSELSQPATV
jgi:dTDP-4-amino-4,6-dideoxygalactose transaminase